MILAQNAIETTQGLRLVLILLSAVFTDNILLSRFLGMCSFLSVSRQFRSAVGLGLSVLFVNTFTCILNYYLYVYLLLPLEPYGVPADSLKLILFIIVIAAFVQLLEMLIERISLPLYYALGIFLPLVTVNCAILGTSLFMVTDVASKSFGASDVAMYGFGAGLGWFLAIVLIAGIRRRLANSPIPAALQGPGITLIITGIMAMAFIIFQGMIKL